MRIFKNAMYPTECGLMSEFVGANQVKNGIHHWSFAIERVGVNGCLGIASICGGERYALILSKGKRLIKKRGISAKEDRHAQISPVNNGDIIEMKLDLYQKKLYYKFNDMATFWEGHFDQFGGIPSITYRLMAEVATYSNSKWRLLQYKMTY